MDFNRIGNIIKRTKDKLIVATDTDLLVVMDLDSYEELIKENQLKTEFLAKNALNSSIEPEESVNNVDIIEETEEIDSFNPNMKRSGLVSVKDVIAKKAEQAFVPPVPPIEGFNQVDESDEFYFEEVDE